MLVHSENKIAASISDSKIFAVAAWPDFSFNSYTGYQNVLILQTVTRIPRTLKTDPSSAVGMVWNHFYTIQN
jgi:hypothetical protein